MYEKTRRPPSVRRMSVLSFFQTLQTSSIRKPKSLSVGARQIIGRTLALRMLALLPLAYIPQRNPVGLSNTRRMPLASNVISRDETVLETVPGMEASLTRLGSGLCTRSCSEASSVPTGTPAMAFFERIYLTTNKYSLLMSKLTPSFHAGLSIATLPGAALGHAMSNSFTT